MSGETAAQAVARRRREREAIERREAAIRRTVQAVTSGGRRAAAVSREALLNVDAAMRGAANLLTLNKADVIAAALDPAIQTPRRRGINARFNTNLAEQQTRNRYDAERRSLARTTGQVLGTLAPIVPAAAVAPHINDKRSRP